MAKPILQKQKFLNLGGEEGDFGYCDVCGLSYLLTKTPSLVDVMERRSVWYSQSCYVTEGLSSDTLGHIPASSLIVPPWASISLSASVSSPVGVPTS